MSLIISIISLVVYFLPSIIAFVLNKGTAIPIFILNFFLGWTFIGWVVALIWSVIPDKQ